MMLIRHDPFRDLDRLSQQVFGAAGTTTRPAMMPMDAWQEGEEFIIELDLPGVDPASIDLDVERNVLTVKAERPALSGHYEHVVAERPRGVFNRQLLLGQSLDTERVNATYAAGVLTLRIPIAETAKPRKIEIAQAADERRLIDA
jgi:HSP20 family protein